MLQKKKNTKREKNSGKTYKNVVQPNVTYSLIEDWKWIPYVNQGVSKTRQGKKLRIILSRNFYNKSTIVVL